ncbi:MAG: SxtJ family membrane protein [Nitrospinota bacterium]|nr:SxtJ family membrane protein [Nitrospinota bacterium]MEC8956807.1 SxtJ family membrane protein [Nitrospinota bacterium]MEC9018712.1 SxtJ family membrane protein [Nitrospinota bacterium]MED5353652.1 SxtJ family membrane protein [Nitrospinota bacterium]
MSPFDPSEKQLKQFGLIMAGMFSFFAAIFLYKTWYVAVGVLGILILLFLGFRLAAPMCLLPVYKKWMRFAEVIGNFNTKVILSITYFLVFTPIRIVASVFRDDPLSRKIEPEKDSYWLDCERRDSDPKSYEKQF